MTCNSPLFVIRVSYDLSLLSHVSKQLGVGRFLNIVAQSFLAQAVYLLRRLLYWGIGLDSLRIPLPVSVCICMCIMYSMPTSGAIWAVSFILFTFSALLNDEQQENTPISAANLTQVTERLTVERQSEATPLVPQTTRYNRLLRETSAVPKKSSAVQHQLKRTGYQVLDDGMQYMVSACLEWVHHRAAVSMRNTASPFISRVVIGGCEIACSHAVIQQLLVYCCLPMPQLGSLQSTLVYITMCTFHWAYMGYNFKLDCQIL